MKRFPLSVSLVLLLLVVAVVPAAASPVISGLSPASAPNNDDATVTITGSGFNTQTTVWLQKSLSYDPPVYGTIVSRSPTSITCIFPIKGLSPSRYHVWVNSPFTDSLGRYVPEDVALLDSGFEIYQGTAMTTTTTTTTVPANGSIRISSIPSGANIYLDNEYKGLTTLTVTPVQNGNHIVRVRLSGYQDWIQTVVVLGDSQSVSATLIKIPITTTAAPVTTASPAPTTPVPTTKSPIGTEAGIIAIIGAVLLVLKRT